MVDDDTAAGIQEALQGASSIQLYQMQALIEVMLADTKRMIAARTALHLGQAVRFIDHRAGQERLGKLIAKHDAQATVMEDGVRRTWKIPYVAIEPAAMVLANTPNHMTHRRSHLRREGRWGSRWATKGPSTTPRALRRSA